MKYLCLIYDQEQMRQGIKAAEAEPDPDPSLVFDYAYEEGLPSFAADLDEVRRALEGDRRGG